jgi:hypothetical protein
LLLVGAALPRAQCQNSSLSNPNCSRWCAPRISVEINLASESRSRN